MRASQAGTRSQQIGILLARDWSCSVAGREFELRCIGEPCRPFLQHQLRLRKKGESAGRARHRHGVSGLEKATRWEPFASPPRSSSPGRARRPIRSLAAETLSSVARGPQRSGARAPAHDYAGRAGACSHAAASPLAPAPRIQSMPAESREAACEDWRRGSVRKGEWTPVRPLKTKTDIQAVSWFPA